nr:hypothetical protein Itr_chr11CG08400 [Ipomoea trifida]
MARRGLSPPPTRGSSCVIEARGRTRQAEPRMTHAARESFKWVTYTSETSKHDGALRFQPLLSAAKAASLRRFPGAWAEV